MNYLGPDYYTSTTGFEWDEDNLVYVYDDDSYYTQKIIWDTDLNDVIIADSVDLTFLIVSTDETLSDIEVNAGGGETTTILEEDLAVGEYTITLPLPDTGFTGLYFWNFYTFLTVTKIDISGNDFWTNFEDQYESA